MLDTRAVSAWARCRRGCSPTPSPRWSAASARPAAAWTSICATARRSTCRPTPNYPVNLGMACPKGWEALTPLRAPRPRDDAAAARTRSGELRAGRLGHGAARRFVDAIQGDPGRSTARSRSPSSAPARSSPRRWRCSARWPSSAWAWCTATATRGSAWPPRSSPTSRSFGFDAPPYTYADFEESDVLVLVGANLCIAHPILWERVLRNPHQPEIIVIDPRKTETAMAATQHLAAAAEVRSDAASTAWRDLLIAARLDRPRVHRRAHRAASTSSRAFVAAVHARARGRGDRL